MVKYLTMDFVSTIQKLNQDINRQLNNISDTNDNISAPKIGLYTQEYERTQCFVNFNEWLKNANKEELISLAHNFGLLPVVYTLTGVNVIQATLMQETSKIDVLGVITYIRIALIHTMGDNTSALDQLCTVLFSDTYRQTDDMDIRSNFISLLISKCINTREDITYEQSVARLMEPILIA